MAVNKKACITVYLLHITLFLFCNPETEEDASRDYLVSELVVYKGAASNTVILLKDEETITLYERDYQISGEYTLRNDGPECEQTVGLAMYTLYSELSVMPNIHFWVNGKAVSHKIILNDVVGFDTNIHSPLNNMRNDNAGIFEAPINWALISITLPTHSVVVIRFQYRCRNLGYTGSSYIFLNEISRFLKLSCFRGMPEFILNIENKSLPKISDVDKSNWIANIHFYSSKNNSERLDLCKYLINEDFNPANDLFSIAKTNHDTWTIRFTENFVNKFGRNAALTYFGWGYQSTYCSMTVYEETAYDAEISLRYLEGDYQYSPSWEKGEYPGHDITKRKLRPYEFFLLTNNQLKLMRNAFYARHGYVFTDKDLEKAFSLVWVNFSYKYNPDFKETLLTDIDRYNIETIRKIENLQNNISGDYP